MNKVRGSEIIRHWPEESREAARLVLDRYGEAHEVTASLLIWYGVGPWKRMMASRSFNEHHFPVPHIDSVTSVIDYRVPEDYVSLLAKFDGSVVVDRTAGEVSARCHDEEANLLALNLVHDIVTGQKSVTQARQHYAQEFLDVRRGKAAPYMDRLRFGPAHEAADPDHRVLSDGDLEQAASQGAARQL